MTGPVNSVHDECHCSMDVWIRFSLKINYLMAEKVGVKSGFEYEKTDKLRPLVQKWGRSLVFGN
jgi:hypothetical protein